MPAVALAIALGCGAIAKSWLLASVLGSPIPFWRPSLLLCGVVAGLVGLGFTFLPPRFEWVELAIGIPVVLTVYCVVTWKFAFRDADRTLFRKTQMGEADEGEPAGRA